MRQISVYALSWIAYTYADNPKKPGLPKLTTLTLSYVDLLYGACDDLFAFLKKRDEKGAPVKELTIQCCQVHSEDDLPDFEDVVENVEYDYLEVIGPEVKWSDSYSDDSEDM